MLRLSGASVGTGMAFILQAGREPRGEEGPVEGEFIRSPFPGGPEVRGWPRGGRAGVMVQGSGVHRESERRVRELKQVFKCGM